jgi:predicted secreted protein
MRQRRGAPVGFAIACVAVFVASIPHAQPSPKSNQTTLPAGWALPIGARGRSPNTIYRPINVAALRAVPKSRCSPVEVAPSVWVTPLCAPMPRFSRSPRATPRPITFRAGAVPETADLRAMGLEGPIKDQQQAGVCWSFAISTVMDNAVRRVGKGDVFAPLHVIAQDEWELLWDKGAGRPIVGEVTWPYDPIKACKLDEHLANEHYCKDAYGVDGGSWRSDPDLVRERNQAEASGSYKIIAMHSLASKPGNVDEIASVLAGGQNIWVAIELNMTSWTNSRMDTGGQIRDWEPDGTGGHAVTISGYRTIDGKRQFLVHNSWGMSWADNGFAWISERMMKERLNDAFVLTLGDSAGNPLSPAAPTSFGAEDNGKTVTLKKGQSFLVALTSNPSTGLDWVVKSDGGLGAPASDTESDPDQAGGRARRKFTWTNAAAGTHVLELEYRRGSDAPARTFRLTITISD